MLKKIAVQDAVGTRLAHDITEIRPGEFKGAAFRKGHTVCDEDICHLQKLGKNHLYVLDLAADEIHENEAAAILAAALAGEGVAWENTPKEGKIDMTAAIDGLLSVNTAALAAFNMVDEVMCATLHSHTLVSKGKRVAATRAIPLVMKRAPIERAAAIARQNGGVLSVRALRRAKAGIVVTGSEVFNGLIQDRFAPILTGKVTALGSEVAGVSFAPDDADLIRQAIVAHLENGCDLLLLSGGMSVDPDDVTRLAIRQAGRDRDALWGLGPAGRDVSDGLDRRGARCWAFRPAGCTTARRCSISCCRASLPASGSARKSSPSSATAACARTARSAASRAVLSERGHKTLHPDGHGRNARNRILCRHATWRRSAVPVAHRPGAGFILSRPGRSSTRRTIRSRSPSRTARAPAGCRAAPTRSWRRGCPAC